MTRSTRTATDTALDAAFTGHVAGPQPLAAGGFGPMAGFELALSLIGLGMDIAGMVQDSQDDTGAKLDAISGQLEQLVNVSGEILNQIDDVRVLLTTTYLSEIRSDLYQSLSYFAQWQATGSQASAQLAIEKSVEAMADITTFAATAPVEQALLSATMIAAVSVRELIIGKLQDGATSGEFKGELTTARGYIGDAVALLHEQVIDSMGFTSQSGGRGADGVLNWLFTATNHLGETSQFAYPVSSEEDVYRFSQITTLRQLLEYFGPVGQDLYTGYFEWLVEEDKALIGAYEVERIGRDLDFVTSGKWLRGRDGTVDDVLTSNQKGGYTSPDTLDGYRGNDRLTGGAGDDTLRGWEGNDTLTGNRGDDVLRGAEGRDVLMGGTGHNVLDGGTGIDTVSYAWATKGVTVSLDLSRAQRTGVSADQLTGVENLTGSDFADRLTGSTAANALAGGGGDDRLDGFRGDDRLGGGNGDDVLTGGAGKDVLTGGAGRDRFVFDQRPAKDNVDTIADFDPRHDTIAFDKAVFRAFADLRAGDTIGRDAFKDIGQGRVDPSDHVLYDSKTGDLFYDADGSGKGAAVLIAHLDPHLHLAAADFIVI